MNDFRINVHSVLGIENLGGPGYCLSVSLQMTDGQKREAAAQLLGAMPTDKVEQFLRAEFAELFDGATAAQPAGYPVEWECKAGGLMPLSQRRYNLQPDWIKQHYTRIQPAAARVPLTDEQIEAGRHETFSTGNPFCPCTDKTMRKAVRWAERAHGITAAIQPSQRLEN